MTDRVKQLEDEQLENFDAEYVSDDRWQIVKACIDKDFPKGDFSFLDLGGGNGVFADKVLHHYPNANATVLDNSELLLNKNTEHSRKSTILSSVEDMKDTLSGEKFDIIFMNWLLHHVIADSYARTTQYVVDTLKITPEFLTDRGRVSVFENIYDGYIFDNLPSHLIFQLTSSKALAGPIKKLGANTAGVGVCFRSKKNWQELIKNSGLSILKYSDDSEWHLSQIKRLILHIRSLRVGHFWTAANN